MSEFARNVKIYNQYIKLRQEPVKTRKKYSYKEEDIAKEFKLSDGTVRSIVHKMRKFIDESNKNCCI